MFQALLFIIFTGGCSYTYSNNVLSNVLKREDAKEFIREKEKVEKLSSIMIDSRIGKIEILEGDDFYVDISYLYWNKEPVYEVKDGVLTFNDEETLPNTYSIRFEMNNYIKVYLPKDEKVDVIMLSNDSGDINASGISAEDFQLSCSYGDVTIKDSNLNKAKIELSSGDSNLENIKVNEMKYTNSYGESLFEGISGGDETIEASEAAKIDINMSSGKCTINNMAADTLLVDNSYGDIICDTLSVKDFTGDLSSGTLEISNGDIEKTKIVNSYGDTKLQLIGDDTEYGFDLNTSYGDITVDGEKYEEHYNRDLVGDRQVSAELSSGDISIEFKK